MAKVTFFDFFKPIVIALTIASFIGLFGFALEFNYMRSEIKKINKKLDISIYESNEKHKEEIRLLERALLIKKIESYENK